ncbi:MAG: PorT family protein [Chitinophagaceae bacterium]|nr:MAG: PorT family protein [Chitinophagaceae bacterium]
MGVSPPLATSVATIRPQAFKRRVTATYGPGVRVGQKHYLVSPSIIKSTPARMPLNRYKVFGALCATLFSLAASAQKTEFGFLAGPQYTTASYSLHGKEQVTKGKFGGHVGAIVKIPFEGRLFFTPSLYYSLKGFSVALTDTSSNPGIDAVTNDIRLHTAELSPLFTVYVGRHTDRGPYVQFGPSIDMNLAGTEHITLNDGREVKRSMKFEGDSYSRFTPSLVFRFGVETSKGLFFNAHILQGVGSLNNNDLGPSIRQRVIGVSVGKIFRRK